MNNEEEIKLQLESKFSYLEGRILIQRPRRMYMEVEYANLMGLLQYAEAQLGFKFLVTITGLDEGDKLALVYHIGRDPGIMLNIKTSVPKSAPKVISVMDIYPNAEIYEREIVDLFGAQVEGLPSGNRYPLTDDWPQGEFPLRKDWKQKDE